MKRDLLLLIAASAASVTSAFGTDLAIGRLFSDAPRPQILLAAKDKKQSAAECRRLCKRDQDYCTNTLEAQSQPKFAVGEERERREWVRAQEHECNEDYRACVKTCND